MTPSQVAAEIRAEAFDATPSEDRDLLRAAARRIATALATRLDRIAAGKPWWWRLFFRAGLTFAVDVLRGLAEEIESDLATREAP